jgi:hypothetical protein
MRPVLSLAIAALLTSTLLFGQNALAQNKLEQFFQDALTRVIGAEKLSQLKAATKGVSFLNRSWDVTDRIGNKNKIVTTAQTACFERVGTNYKVCSNYSGVETARIGFNSDMEAANGDSAQIIATPNGLVIEWMYRDCSATYKQTWAIGNQLVSNGMGPATISSSQTPPKCEGS